MFTVVFRVAAARTPAVDVDASVALMMLYGCEYVLARAGRAFCLFGSACCTLFTVTGSATREELLLGVVCVCSRFGREKLRLGRGIALGFSDDDHPLPLPLPLLLLLVVLLLVAARLRPPPPPLRLFLPPEEDDDAWACPLLLLVPPPPPPPPTPL